MLRAAVILGLAVAAMSASVDRAKDVSEQVIRFGSIGTTFSNVVGVLNPVSPVFGKGVPGFEFVRVVNGVPSVETDRCYFRCSVMSDFYVPHGADPKPVLLCRNDAFERTDSTAERIIFLFSAEDLSIPSGVTEMELNVGRNTWKSFISSHAAAFAVPGHDNVRKEVVTSVHPFDSVLTHDIPVKRAERQFGGGFSGSGAQAGSSSFGGGGGFGGFPGGGFGGGFSGSQASAGSSSFGGGGGFFG